MPVESQAQTRAQGVIHDLGYRGYDGPRLGRRQIVTALTWHSFRSAFGFGRGAKAKILPVIAIAVLLLPAVINAFQMSQGDARIVPYDTYRAQVRVLVMAIFVAVQAPELVSRDLRSRVLPLYFSRPMKAIDYPLAKFLAFTAACLVMMEVPLLALYGGSIANVHGGAAVWAQTRALIPGLLIGLMWAVVLAAISLFLASLTGRRGYASGLVAIFFLLTFTLSEILLQVESAAGPGPGPGGAGGPGPGGPPTGPIGSPPAPVADMAEKVAGLFSPFTLFDGVRQWLGGVWYPNESLGVEPPGGFGAVYALVLLAVLALCLTGLAARYRKAALS
jgi:ABC-2 type transport system permease protein